MGFCVSCLNSGFGDDGELFTKRGEILAAQKPQPAQGCPFICVPGGGIGCDDLLAAGDVGAFIAHAGVVFVRQREFHGDVYCDDVGADGNAVHEEGDQALCAADVPVVVQLCEDRLQLLDGLVRGDAALGALFFQLADSGFVGFGFAPDVFQMLAQHVFVAYAGDGLGQVLLLAVQAVQVLAREEQLPVVNLCFADLLIDCVDDDLHTALPQKVGFDHLQHIAFHGVRAEHRHVAASIALVIGAVVGAPQAEDALVPGGAIHAAAAVAAVHAAGEQVGVLGLVASADVQATQGLHAIPQLQRYDGRAAAGILDPLLARLVLVGVVLAVMGYTGTTIEDQAPDVFFVVQKVVYGVGDEGLAGLGFVPRLVERVGNAGIAVAGGDHLEYGAHHGGLLRIEHKPLPLVHVVAQRRLAACPHALYGGLGHSLHDLGGEVFDVVLVERGDHRGHQIACGRVLEVLGDGDQLHVEVAEHAAVVDGVRHAAGEAIQLVYDHLADFSGLCGLDHLEERGAFVGLAAEGLVNIPFVDGQAVALRIAEYEPLLRGDALLALVAG